MCAAVAVLARAYYPESRATAAAMLLYTYTIYRRRRRSFIKLTSTAGVLTHTHVNTRMSRERERSACVTVIFTLLCCWRRRIDAPHHISERVKKSSAGKTPARVGGGGALHRKSTRVNRQQLTLILWPNAHLFASRRTTATLVMCAC